MPRYPSWSCATLCLLMMLCGCARGPAPEHPRGKRAATLALRNGVIFTARGDSETVRALALIGDKVLAAGSWAEVKRRVDDNTRVVDLGGRFVMPGFHDAHLHLQMGGGVLALPKLHGVRSLAKVLEEVKRVAAATPPGEWIFGLNWDHTLWAGQHWPTRKDLDKVAPDNPVYLRRAGENTVWVNSRALATAQINAESADPKAGKIVREQDGRTPSGILKGAATAWVRPVTSDVPARRDLKLALDQARSLGITSVNDLGSSLDELARLRDAGELTVRVNLWGDIERDLAMHEGLRRRFPRSNPWLIYASLKGVVDGMLSAGTAALLEPYGDANKGTGTANYGDAPLKARVREATRRGFQVNLHAIGDRAVRQALDAFEAALPEGKPLRHRVEHAKLVHVDDLPRFARLGVVASIQPCHLVTDQRWVEQRLGRRRARARVDLWQALRQAGAPLALGTGWPAGPLNPFRNLYAAITRKQVPAKGPGWQEAQRLTIGQALRAYTYGSAFATRVEDRRGTLAPGMDADLVIVDRDLLRAKPETLLEAKVVTTIVAGKVVFGTLP